MASIGSIGFSAGGIDVTEIVTSLMQVERQPLTALLNRQAAVKLQSDTVARLKTSLDTLKSQASALVAGGIAKLSSTVSGSLAATASLSPTASAGSLSFTVDRLAQAHGTRTASTFVSSSSVATTAATLGVSTTSSALGVTGVSVGAGVALGKHTISVTQATAGATRVGAALAAPVTITGANNTIDIAVDGAARTITIANGVYSDGAALVAAVNTAIGTGGGVTASLDAGRLRLTTTHEGSSATLQVTGGSALADAGLAVDAVAASGSDGLVKVGSNPAVAVTSAGTGATVVVPTGTGNLTLTLGAGMRVGDATAAAVSTGDRSLSAVAAAINGAGVGATAATVDMGNGAWVLQMGSTRTGVANALVSDASAFVGGLVETSTAQDATITVGAGAGAYSVSSGANTFNNVMPGVALTVTAVTATPVTVSVARDDNATADAVGKLVAAATTLLAEINLQTKFDPKTKKAAPLTGDAGIKLLAEQVRGAVTALVGGTSTSLAANVGITAKRDGTLDFDRAKFLAALAADPAGVERIFARGGSTTGNVTFVGATETTAAGSYDVQVTTAATRASVTEEPPGGFLPGQVLSVRRNGVTASYTVGASDGAAEIAAGLGSSIAAAALAVNVEATPGGIELTATVYGGAGTFDADLGNGWTTSAGTDVVGTIDGQTAVGIGRRLSLLATSSSAAKGLAVDVDEGVTGALGPVTYEPGIAARLVALATTATAPGGALTSSTTSYDAKYQTFNTQIERFEDRLAVKETQYRRQWTAVQSLLSSLQTQGDWLAGQLAGLSNSGD